MLSGTHWKSYARILKTIYTGAVCPVLECGVSALSTATKIHTKKAGLNLGLRTINHWTLRRPTHLLTRNRRQVGHGRRKKKALLYDNADNDSDS